MKHGIYIGPIAHLKGKTAILREHKNGRRVLAQFDDCELTWSDRPVQEGLITDALGFGWHEFCARDFKEDESHD